nr:hypothetical protein [uncultured Eisenbergiella sp.]
MEKKEKKLLAGIVLFLFLIAVIIGFLLINKKNSSPDISGLIAESLAEADFDFFNQDKSKTQTAANTAASVLYELSTQKAAKEEMTEAVSHALFKSGLGLSQKEADRLAEWIVDFYLQEIEDTDTGSSKSINSSTTNQETILAEQIKQDLTTISEYLTQLDKTVNHNKEEILNLTTGQANEFGPLSSYLQSLQKTINSLQSQFAAYETNYNEEQNVTLAEFENIKVQIDSVQENLEEIQKQAGSSETNITQRIDSGINSLLSNLDRVHSDISSTQDEIKDILSTMDTADTRRMAEIITRFTDINNKLVEINSSMDTAHNEIKVLIGSLQETVQSTGERNKQELLSTLTAINNSFSDQSTENYTQLVNSLQTQTEGIQNWFHSLDESVMKNFEDLSNTVSTFEQSTSTNMEELVNNFNQSFTKLSSSVDSINQVTANNKDAILNKISELEINTSSGLEKVETELQSVFQRASDGKKLLASALLAKNVSAEEDATFRELYEAILSIEQQIVIGVEQVPGSISYEYHYHTGDPENGSGCYTKKLYHQHGPECYSKATCTVTVHTNGGFFSEGDDWCPCHGNVHRIKQNVIRRHSSCGAADNYGQISFTEHHGPGTDGFKGYDSSTHSYDKLSCGKTNATFVGWDVGCGMVDGQIIAAHIIYDQSAVPTALASGQPKPENYIPKIYDDYIISGNAVHSNQPKSEEDTSSEAETSDENECFPETEDTSNPEVETPAETENTDETESLMETENVSETETNTGQNSSSVPESEDAETDDNSASVIEAETTMSETE